MSDRFATASLVLRAVLRAWRRSERPTSEGFAMELSAEIDAIEKPQRDVVRPSNGVWLTRDEAARLADLLEAPTLGPYNALWLRQKIRDSARAPG